jgi:N-acetylglucosaminyldiphosphoundecaprenol N-acetyl-beta-D-mannosaminyltransferase
MSSAAIIDEINAAKPDFVVVALGAKKGQAWIQKNRGQLNAPVISHLGAVINFVAGSVERAPMVWQRFGLEWVWRIKQEPVLWKRYLLDGFAFAGLMVTKVFPLVIYDRVLKIKSGFNSPCVIEWLGDGKDVVRLVGSFKHQELQSVKVFLSSILNGKTVELGSNNLVLDFTDVEYIDGAFIATLMLFQRALEKQGKLLTITNVSARIKRILTMNNVRKRFVLK